MSCDQQHHLSTLNQQLLDVARIQDKERAWVLQPRLRDSMSAYYQHLKRVVENEKREDWLRYTHNEMWTLMASEKLVPGERAQRACNQAATMAVEALRAGIHRMSCNLLRYLASLHVCHSPCCCSCPAAYEQIYCIGRLKSSQPNGE
jgi:predicted transcriptional regulator